MQSFAVRVPAGRVMDLVITEAGSDLIVYDQKSASIHTLNDVTASVWRTLDGTMTVQDVAIATGFSTEVVQKAVTQLADAGLLESELASELHTSRSRREFMKKAGAAAAIPVIVSVSAPMAADASSSCPTLWECYDGVGFGRPCCTNGGTPLGLTCKSPGPWPGGSPPWWWSSTGLPWGSEYWPSSFCLP